MRPRVPAFELAVCLAALTSILAVAASPGDCPAQQANFAQQSTAVSISAEAVEIGELLRRGRQLEIERRWGEALSHYESAIRLFPGERSLQQRFDLARLHYDLQRRYTDRSFLQAIADLPPGEALDLYAEVLLKIQSHYVDVPNWKGLVERGTNNLAVALRERAFVERNLPHQNQSAVDALQHEIRSTLGRQAVPSRSAARDAVALAAQLAQQRLGIHPTTVVMEYVCGAANALDPYSAYLTPNQLNEVYAQIEGNFVGLGIELKTVAGQLTIIRVIPGSPAEQAGIRAGDRIVSVDGRSTARLSTDQAADLLQGETGSVVSLVLSHPPQPSRVVSIRRRRVEVPSIDGVKILDPSHGVGYLRVVSFQKTTCRDLEEALWRLHHGGMQRLIIDVRGNPGGLLVTAVEVADKFVDSGIIVSTRGRNSQEDFTYSAHVAGTWRTPLVVLIDQDSASAAEIFAGAIRDHRRGTVVGVRSFGKGSVQGVFPLDFGQAGLRLTTARFYSPTGRPYSGRGVEPHVLVHHVARPVDGSTDVPPEDDHDPMLLSALQAVRGLQGPR